MSARWLGRGPNGDHWASLEGDVLTVSLGTARAYRDGTPEGREIDEAIGRLAAELGRELRVVSDDGSEVTTRAVPS